MITGICVGDTFRCKHSTSGFYKVGKYYFVLSVGEDEFMMTDESGSAGNGGTGHAWSDDEVFWQTFERAGAAAEREEKFARLCEMAGEKQPDISAEGRKDDTGKLPYDLIAPEFLAGTAEILAFGAAKYAPRNWEKGMAWSRPFSALMRHMWAWWAGEKLDPETGKSHLWHASCCLMFLVAYEQRSAGTDDRPNSA